MSTRSPKAAPSSLAASRTGVHVPGEVPRPKRNDEEQPPVYVDVVTFDKQVETVAEHLEKDRRVAVTGRLEYREWEDQQDNDLPARHGGARWGGR